MNAAEEFWQFSLTLYGRPEVARQCLELQDKWNAKVNLLLWLAWLEQRGQLVDNELLTHAENSVDEWNRTIIQPLRQVRRQLRAQFLASEILAVPATSFTVAGGAELMTTVYQALKTTELHTEQVEQEMLASLVADLPPSPALPAGTNLRGYFAYLQLPDDLQQAFIRLL
jgi:uncharacterized protein (TIGR02444 family)